MVAIRHRIFSGQSLNIGGSGGGALSLVSEAENAKRVNLDGSLVDLVATAAQEPGISAGYRLAAADPTRVAGISVHGLGGRSIAELSKGGSTGVYAESVATSTAARAAATARGDEYTASMLHWIQGERDQGTADTDQPTYIARLTQLLNDYRADLLTPGLRMVTSQMSTWAYYDKPARIGLAQLHAARTIPGIHIVGGQYQLPYAADGLHMTRVGYYRLGELHARASQALTDGAGWAPFAPISSTVTGNQIALKFHVPHGPLVFDTTTVPAQPSMGFSLAGTNATITNVAITTPDTVTITASKTLPLGISVGYGVAHSNGFSGLGNLRDSEPAVSAYDGAPIPNWCCHFLDVVSVKPAPPLPRTAFHATAAYWVGPGLALYPIARVGGS